MLWKPWHGRRNGFTLVELLTVIAIIAILLSLLVPSLAKAKRATRAAVCMSNLHQIGVAEHLYMVDYQGIVLRGDLNMEGRKFYAGSYRVDVVWYELFAEVLNEKGGEKTDDISKLGYFRCPSFPHKEHQVTYLTSGITFNPALKDRLRENRTVSDQEIRTHGIRFDNFSKLSMFTKPAQTISKSECDDDTPPVYGDLQANPNGEDAERAARVVIDFHRRGHLPFMSDQRVSTGRHEDLRKVHNLYYDGHAGKQPAEEMVLDDWRDKW